MKIQLDIEKLIEQGTISNELDFERVLIAERKLRVLAKKNEKFKILRIKLREIIEKYEQKNWSKIDSVDEIQILQSDKYEKIAENEQLFINNRKQLIKTRLKQNNLNQNDLGQILGHKSKTHISELINGIKPFTLRDLVIIHRLLDIELNKLIPIYLSFEDQIRIKETVSKMNKPKIKLELH
jgi:hypothetical protein